MADAEDSHPPPVAYNTKCMKAEAENNSIKYNPNSLPRCGATRMRMFTTQVKQDKIDTYIDYHNNIFPEVTKGLTEKGKICRLEINRLGETNTLVMVIETPKDVDLDVTTAKDSAYLQNPRCKEWEQLMESYFVPPGWQELTNIHSSEVHWGK